MQHDGNQLFETITSDYGHIINKVCYFYAANVDDFDDMRQETLINLWRGAERFRGESALSSWVYRVAINSCVSYFRKNRRPDSTPIDLHPELITDDTDKASMLREMYQLINRLGDVDKAIVLMWLDGYDYETIAEVTGLNRPTVGTRLHRIKEKLVKMSNS
ncbi:MAG: sigma-70 family RNA polymerase sigma factor [Muribaculaceae bacterium]|nr:sigma-70 family RNA polymerase sigma factor [Muribaculaceae bacterium]